MILCVTASRHWTDAATIWRELDAIHAETPITVLIHGAAYGGDLEADRWARTHGVLRKPVRPDYDRYGRYAAPVIRNRQMVDMADKVIAFRAEGKSNGTDSTTTYAEKEWKLLRVVHESES